MCAFSESGLTAWRCHPEVRAPGSVSRHSADVCGVRFQAAEYRYIGHGERWLTMLAGTKQSAERGQVMSNVIAEVTIEVLQAFADAWNRHDVEALMSFMSDDCVFESSAGPDICGTRYEGRQAVRDAFAEVWTTFSDANWGNARHFVHEDKGVSEWTFTGTRADRTRVEVHGCDLFTFRDGKIALKNSYRKNRPPLDSPKR
jgi:steroid delta-isomerase-like uncharacterized protein